MAAAVAAATLPQALADGAAPTAAPAAAPVAAVIATWPGADDQLARQAVAAKARQLRAARAAAAARAARQARAAAAAREVREAEQARQAAQARAARQAAAERAAAAARASREHARSGLSPQAIAQGMLAQFGWGQDQWGCLDALWSKESGWQVNASNAGSGAYGIPQALPGSKMASAGPDWQTNPATQIRWGLGYIAGRYGSPCAAWANSQAYNFY